VPAVYGYCNFQNPYMAFRHLLLARIVAAGTSFSPLPCHLRHGYRVTSANRVEVQLGADGHASAPLSGAATDAPQRAPQEDLHIYPTRVCADQVKTVDGLCDRGFYMPFSYNSGMTEVAQEHWSSRPSSIST
jgi:hypothetical protein